MRQFSWVSCAVLMTAAVWATGCDKPVSNPSTGTPTPAAPQHSSTTGGGAEVPMSATPATPAPAAEATPAEPAPAAAEPTPAAPAEAKPE